LLAKIQEKIHWEEQVTRPATRLNTISAEVTLEVPEKHKAQWLKEIFEFTDTEMAHVLGISVETLRKWLKDQSDKHAMQLIRFHRLINLTQLAKGVIRPNGLGYWVHRENPSIGKVVPLNLLADAAGYDIVAAVVEDIRAGISD
jgi:predicted DNA-binding protein (UPF0251 family)